MKKVMIIFLCLLFIFVSCTDLETIPNTSLECEYDEFEYQGICYPQCRDDEYNYEDTCHVESTHLNYIRENGLAPIDNGEIYVSKDEVIHLDYSDDDRELVYNSSNQTISFPDINFSNLVKETIYWKELFGPDEEYNTNLNYQKKNLEKLSSLGMSYSDFLAGAISIEVTQDKIQDIKQLSGDDLDIRSIAGIELFSNLEQVYLSENIYLTSINGLDRLEKLRRIGIRGTAVKKINYNYSSYYLEYFSARGSLVTLSTSGLKNLIMNLRSSGQNIQIGLRGCPNVIIDDLSDIDFDLKSNKMVVYLDYGQIHFENISNDDLYDKTYKGNSLVYEFNNLYFNDIDYPITPGTDVKDSFEVMYNYHSSRIGHLERLSSIQKVIVIYDYFYQTYKDKIDDNLDQSYNHLLSAYADFNISYATLNQLLRVFLMRNGIGVSFEEFIDSRVIEDLSSSEYYDSFYSDNFDNAHESRHNFITVMFDSGERFIIDIKFAIEFYKGNGNDSQEFSYFLVSPMLYYDIYLEYILENIGIGDAPLVNEASISIAAKYRFYEFEDQYIAVGIGISWAWKTSLYNDLDRLRLQNEVDKLID